MTGGPELERIRALAALSPGITLSREGDTIIVAIEGDWAVTVVMFEGSPRWQTFAQQRSSTQPEEGRTVLQLQPRRGGP